MNRTVWIALAAGLCLTPVGPALAGPPPAAADPAQAYDYSALDARETADGAIVQAALTALGAEGFGAMNRYGPKLQAVLDRAPTPYPQVEIRGSQVIVRADDEESAISLGLAGAMQANGADRQVVGRFNVYPMAALLLGSWANERRDADGAVKALRRGLALQPGNALLASELGAAFTLQHRWPEALAVYEAALEANPELGKLARARLLRGKGFALIELGRLDEAEAAYRQSLEAEPNHGGAQHELAYIAGLRKGRPPAPTGIQTGAEAKAADPD